MRNRFTTQVNLLVGGCVILTVNAPSEASGVIFVRPDSTSAAQAIQKDPDDQLN